MLFFKPLFSAFLSLILCTAFSNFAWAQISIPGFNAGDRTEIVFSPGLTLHYSHNPEHRSVKLFGMESIEPKTGSIAGTAFFTNSFGQPTVYWYPVGRQGKIGSEVSGFYWKISAGLLYGYKPPYDKKVPMNKNGFSPGLIPALGYKITDRASVQLNMLGTAGLMLTGSWAY